MNGIESRLLIEAQRLWSEFSGMTDNAKKVGLQGQKRYYYIFSIGTETEHRGKGSTWRLNWY